MTDLNQVEKAIRKNTKALFAESPSNPLLKITDIAGAVELAKRYNLLTLIDNTFMSPYFQRPLSWELILSSIVPQSFWAGIAILAVRCCWSEAEYQNLLCAK